MSRAYIRHTIDVYIDEFDDDELIEEVKRRKIEHLVFAQPEETGSTNTGNQLRSLSIDALEHLLSRRTEKAADALHRLMALFVPSQVITALEAVKAGRTSDAICELDRLIEPAPSATATIIPKEAHQ